MMTDMTRIRIQFEHLVTMAGEDEYRQGEIVIEAGRVEAIRNGVSPSFEGETIDLSGHLILPGFVNTHCHLALSGLKIPRLPQFTDWIKKVVAANQALTWQNRIQGIHAGATTLLRSGVTTLADFLSHPDLMVEYSALPFRQVLFLETLGFQSGQAQGIAHHLEQIFQNHAPSGDKMRLGLAPHAPYSVSPALFKELRRLADHYRCPVSCHVAEVPEEAQFLKQGDGDFLDLLHRRGVYDSSWRPEDLTPVQYLAQLGVLDSLLCVHLNHVEADLDLLVERGAKAAFCPGSTCWFGRPVWMPVKALWDRGVPVGLGTDSLASNESLNFLREIRLAGTLLPEVSRRDILAMATRGGAEALGLECGVLAPGRPADLIGFRLPKSGGAWTDIPFAPERGAVDFSMIQGKVYERPA